MKFQGHVFKTLSDIEVEKKRVFCRLDLNVPMQDGVISDDTRIRAAIPTLRELMAKKARLVIASHLGRPKGKPNEAYSLIPVGQKLAELLGTEVLVPDDCIGDGVRKLVHDQGENQVVLLENLRFHSEEEANDRNFAEALRLGTEAYVTDAFGTMHRAHASTDALPRMCQTKAVGRLVEKELEHLIPLLEAPSKPYAIILGGAKVSDKLKVFENLIRKADRIFLGGAMVFTFLKARGHRVGKSLVEQDMIPQVLRSLEEAEKRNVEVVFPKDFALGDTASAPGEYEVTKDLLIPDSKMGLDVGPKTLELFSDKLKGCKTIFWNGPMGLFEKSPYDRGTMELARTIAGLEDCVKIVGGGDSAAAVHQGGWADRMSHISTGGGATLEFLEGRPLPGLQVLYM